MWLWIKWHCKAVHACMMYTERAPRQQQFHVAPDTQQWNNAVSTSLRWIFKTNKKGAINGYSHSFKIACDISAVSLLEIREWRYIKAINNNNILILTTQFPHAFAIFTHAMQPRSLPISCHALTWLVKRGACCILEHFYSFAWTSEPLMGDTVALLDRETLIHLEEREGERE